MASELHTFGTVAQATAAINAMTPSQHPGMAALLARVKAYALTEMGSFAGQPKYSVYIQCHHDNTISTINIRVYPASLNANSDVQAVSASLNDVGTDT